MPGSRCDSGGCHARHVPRIARIVVPLVALALLTGCAPADEVAPPPSPPASVAASPEQPSPTPTATPRTEPIRLFDGDCGSVIASEKLDALLGDGWKDYDQWLAEDGPGIPDRVAAAPEGTLGGVECRWKAPDGSASGLFDLRVLALPAEAMPASFVQAFATPACDASYDSLVCRLVRVEDGVAILAATLAASEEERHGDALTRGIDAVAASAREQGVTAEPVTPTDAWSTNGTCDEVGGAVADLTDGTFSAGYWEGSEQPEQTLFAEAGVAQDCPMYSDSETIPEDETFRIFTVSSYPGGQWMWSDLVDGATAVEVDGAAAAASFATADDEAGDLYVTDGVNILIVGGADVAFNIDVAERVLARSVE